MTPGASTSASGLAAPRAGCRRGPRGSCSGSWYAAPAEVVGVSPSTRSSTRSRVINAASPLADRTRDAASPGGSRRWLGGGRVGGHGHHNTTSSGVARRCGPSGSSSNSPMVTDRGRTCTVSAARDRRRRHCARRRANARASPSARSGRTAPRAGLLEHDAGGLGEGAGCLTVVVPSGLGALRPRDQPDVQAGVARQRRPGAVAALGEQRGEVRVEGVAAGGPSAARPAARRPRGCRAERWKRSCRVPRVGAGAWSSPREAETGTGGLSSDRSSGSSRRSGPATTARDDAPRGRRDRPTRAHSRRAAGEHVTRTSAMRRGWRSGLIHHLALWTSLRVVMFRSPCSRLAVMTAPPLTVPLSSSPVTAAPTSSPCRTATFRAGSRAGARHRGGRRDQLHRHLPARRRLSDPDAVRRRRRGRRHRRGGRRRCRPGRR